MNAAKLDGLALPPAGLDRSRRGAARHALRWIDTMERRGLLVREPDTTRPPDLLALSPGAVAAIEALIEPKLISRTLSGVAARGLSGPVQTGYDIQY